MVSTVFANDFNKAAAHNSFFRKVVALRIAKYERSRNPHLNIKFCQVEFMTPELKSSYAEVDMRDKQGIDAIIKLSDTEGKLVLSIPVQLKSIFTDYRTVSVAVCDVEKLSNVKYYITIYDNPNGNEYVVTKASMLKQFIQEKQSQLIGTTGYYRQNRVHSTEAFFAIPVYAEESGCYIHQDLCGYANNLFLFCEVPYKVMENKAFKKSLEAFKANSIF